MLHITLAISTSRHHYPFHLPQHRMLNISLATGTFHHHYMLSLYTTRHAPFYASDSRFRHHYLFYLPPHYFLPITQAKAHPTATSSSFPTLQYFLPTAPTLSVGEAWGTYLIHEEYSLSQPSPGSFVSWNSLKEDWKGCRRFQLSSYRNTPRVLASRLSFFVINVKALNSILY